MLKESIENKEIIIDTRDKDSIQESLAKLFGVNIVIIYEFFNKEIQRYIKNKKIDYEFPDFRNLVDFLKLKTGNKFFKIEFSKIFITLTHITTRSNSSNNNEPLYNMYEALINKTEISNYLKSKNIEFSKEKNFLKCYFNGKIVNFNEYRTSYNSSIISMIERRLNNKDHCINGFLFQNNAEKNSNIIHLKYGPEIMNNIMRVLGIDNRDWFEKRNIYKIIVKVPFLKVIIDEYSFEEIEYNEEEKMIKIVTALIKGVISLVIDKEISEKDNYILRLEENLSIPAESIIGRVLVQNRK